MRRWLRTGRVVTVSVVAALAVVAVALGVRWLTTGASTTAAAPGSGPSPEAPSASPRNTGGGISGSPGTRPGWRWESYGGVEVRVPEHWAYGTSASPSCLRDGDDRPYVGRPGVVPTIMCAEPVPPLAARTPYLWFDGAPADAGVRDHGGGWVEETRVVGGVTLTVLSDDRTLRERILGSARVVESVDVHGCPVDHPVRRGPDQRPDTGTGGLETVGTVESVAVCRYQLETPGPAADLADAAPTQPLLSSSEIFGSAARRQVDALLAAPVGDGPDRPGECAEQWRYGDEVIVLRVRGSAGEHELIVRYSGCDGHGVDDGTTRRQLTAEVLRPLLTGGPHGPTSLDGAVAAMVWPATADQPAPDQPTSDEPASSPRAPDLPTSDGPASPPRAPDQPAPDEPVSDQPAPAR